MWSFAQWKVLDEKKEDEALVPLTRLAYSYYGYELVQVH